ncbi:M48 family metallopeptidase [Pacificibacter marinus]|uniref:Metalloprotease LoiP n=1 Tax=Pacificibacter marinus TaxID=658057 RepID=A0A1Y5RT42_9RHOB|nr:M48 family metallopeptidase [Pacificibacter marinus]SEK41151.1 putative metalloprotease [Pacificibacter marinus]SLN24896.1 Metalloprotease LoiP precursor [Pacificibacter marinus]
MLKFAPILIALIYGYVMYRTSAARSSRDLARKSAELADTALREQFMRLAHALDLPRVQVFLYDIDPVNGLAAPDGKVYITRGFYQKFRAGEVTSEEMASVVAHELGHVALGHSQRRMIDFSGQNALRTALAMVISRFIPFVGVYIASALTNMLAARLSRRDEFEADAYASALLHKSGIGTHAQKSLFLKLNKLTGAHGAATPAWFMSHPKVEERIKAIEMNEAKWQV